jgi:DNA-directed RNA polymerase subunit omega
VDNRYTLVIATAKRARQLAKGNEPLTKTDDVATVSIAADEIEDDKVQVCKEEE